MTVFSTILKILNKLKGMLILYTVMLVAITTINQTLGNKVTNFEESKPDMLIVNNDSKNVITDGFVDYIKKHANIKDIDTSNQDKINDAIFYRDVNFVIYIPENFGKDLKEGKEPSLKYKETGDEYAAYSRMLVEKYIKTVKTYKDYYSGRQLIEKVNNIVGNDTKVQVKSSLDTSKMSTMTAYFNFLNYALLAGCVYCITMILASLKQENVRKRTIVSSFNYRKYNRIVLFSNAIVIVAMWILYMILSLILFKDTMFTANGLAFVLNSLVFALCGLSIGFLIGNITTNKAAIGGIVNVVALGTSFLCGCFVPFEYMPDYVLKIAHILPTYYFVANNQLIKTIESFNIDTLKPIFINVGVVLAFTIVFVTLSNYISKKKQRV
ncbi:ABC transporter permease [uncultured Eubacterium sp.]|uniref:ABC transporter permease n=1 Tax=uncultured Eubacterium sp. TaxID=165185 RepID=UPI002673DB99|nr:ABC transporter permease [uncultured Eubacterium sp.]